MEISEQELSAKIEAAKKEGRSELEKSLIADTTWKSVDALKESAVNASRKITEVSEERKSIESERDDLKKKLEEAVAKGNPNQDPKPAPQPTKDPTPTELLATMTEDEEKVLDELCNSDEGLKKAVALGGEKAMAEALQKLRASSPKDAPKDLFASYRKGKQKPPTENIESLLDNALKKRQNKGRQPAQQGRTTVAGVIQDDEDGEKESLRSGGGLLELAAKGQEGRIGPMR